METLISDTGRRKIVIIDNLDFRTEKKCIDQFFSIVISGRKLIAFDVLSPLLTDKGYWYALGQAYKSESWPDHWFDMNDKERFFTASRPSKEMLMNRAERKYLNTLPEKVLLHRTMTEKEWDSKAFGLSWTLDIKVAANSFLGSQWDYEFNDYRRDVHSIGVQKSQIIAYFNRRGEKEIIYKHYRDGELPDIF